MADILTTKLHNIVIFSCLDITVCRFSVFVLMFEVPQTGMGHSVTSFIYIKYVQKQNEVGVTKSIRTSRETLDAQKLIS